MNEILKQRIEEAAAAIAPFNRMSQKRDYFVKGAVFALQNQWISVEEALPNYEEDVLVTNDVGEYWFSHRTENENVMQDENNFASVNGIFKITHWMPISSLEGFEK